MKICTTSYKYFELVGESSLLERCHFVEILYLTRSLLIVILRSMLYIKVSMVSRRDLGV